MHQTRSIRFIGREDLGDWRLNVDPAALVPSDGTGLGCVWELEVIDFERRAWLEDVLKNDELDAYLGKRAPDTDI